MFGNNSAKVARGGRVGLLCLTLAAAGAARAQESALTLDDCLARARTASPELAAALAESAAAAGAARQAGAVPNPELAVEVENFGGDLPRWGESETTWSVAQNLGFLPRRGAAVEAGRRSRGIAAADVAAARRDLRVETARRFYDLLAAQRREELLGGEVAAVDSLVAAVDALVRAGEASPVELARARTERALAAIDQADAAAARRRARSALAALWSGTDADVGRARGDFATDFSLPDRAAVGEREGGTPEMLRQEAELGRQEALARLERATRWPDPTAAAGVRRLAASGERTMVASLSLPLPLFDRRGGAVAEAAARVAQARHAQRALVARLREQRLAAWDGLAAGMAAERALRETVVPQAQLVHGAVGEGYRRGKFGLLDALDARRTLARARLRHLESLAALQSARLELERLLGASLAAPEGDGR